MWKKQDVELYTFLILYYSSILPIQFFILKSYREKFFNSLSRIVLRLKSKLVGLLPSAS